MTYYITGAIIATIALIVAFLIDKPKNRKAHHNF